MTSLVVQKLRHQVLLFAEADRDRSGGEREPSLSFDEWSMLLRRPPNATEPANASPSYRRTRDDLKRWFEVADLGGAGRVSLFDFVMLILRGEFSRAGFEQTLSISKSHATDESTGRRRHAQARRATW